MRQSPHPAYQIRGVFEEFNFPSINKLKNALRKRGIRFRQAELDDVDNKSGARQIYAPRNVYPGKVASHAPDTRWGADIAKLTSNPSSSGHKYILVVVDYFTRQTWATPLMNIQVPTVSAAFEAIAEANGHRQN